MWRIWWAPNNASKWQMGFNLAFKGLIGHNPGLLLAVLLDTTPWADIYTWWDWAITQLVGVWHLCVWGLGLTQTCISGFLLFGPWVCYECNSGGNLELWQRNRAPLTFYQIIGHKEPVLRLRCIRTGRAQTQILFYFILFCYQRYQQLSLHPVPFMPTICISTLPTDITVTFPWVFPVTVSDCFLLLLCVSVPSLHVTQPVSTAENKQWSSSLCSFPVALNNH